MQEIVYPLNPAPVITAALKNNAQVSQPATKEEMLPIVEESGQVVGQAPRSFCHGGGKPLHPVVHLHVMDREGRLYLQKRSMKKELLPGRWDTSVGGHISYGETVQEALFREASEELGFRDFNPFFVKDYIYESETEREMIFVWAAIGGFTLRPDAEEVEEGRFWSGKDIEKNLGKGVFTPNFEQEFDKFYNSLLSLL